MKNNKFVSLLNGGGMSMKKFDDKEYMLLYLIAFLMLVAVSPLFNVMITCGDDMENFSLVRRGEFLKGTWEAAKETGRFQYMIIRYVQYVPYLVHNHVYYSVVTIIPVLLCFFTFAKCVSLFTNDRGMGLFVFSFLGISFQIMSSLTIPISWPIFFPLGIAILFFSVYTAIYYKRSNKKSMRYVSAVLFFISLLFYEIHVMYLLFIAMIFFYYNYDKNNTLKAIVIKSFWDLMPYILAVTMYVIMYFGFQQIYPVQYSGIEISTNASSFFDVIVRFSRLSWPTSVYFSFIGFFKTPSLYGCYDHNLLYAFMNGGLTCYLKGLLGVTVVWYLLKMTRKMDKTKLIILIIISPLLIYVPQILTALSSKYQELHLPAYTPTFYSFIGTSMFITMLFVAMYRLPKSNAVRNINAVIILIVVFFIGYITQFSNEQFALDYKKTTDKLSAVEHFFSSEEYKQITHDGSVIYLHDFNKNMSTYIWGEYEMYDLWEAYSILCTGSGVKDMTDYDSFKEWVHKKSNQKHDIYISSMYQTENTNEILITLAKIDKSQITNKLNDITVDEVTTFYYSPEMRYSILYPVSDSSNLNSNRLYKSIKVDNSGSNEGMSPTVITKIKDKGIYFSDIIISNFVK